MSSASPECLIVVGGYNDDATDVRTIEIFSHGEWLSVAIDLPKASYYLAKGMLHFGSLCLYGLYDVTRTETYDVVYCCKVDSLLASCTLRGRDDERVLWKTIKYPPTEKYMFDIILSFEEQLVAVTEKFTYVYSPIMQSWVLMGENPLDPEESALSALPLTGRSLVVTWTCLYKATLEGTYYYTACLCIILFTHHHAYPSVSI